MTVIVAQDGHMELRIFQPLGVRIHRLYLCQQGVILFVQLDVLFQLQQTDTDTDTDEYAGDAKTDAGNQKFMG